MPEQDVIPFRGLDRASPAVQTEKGACRTLSGVARPPGRQGWVPAPKASKSGITGIQSLARQPLEDGPRLLALTDQAPNTIEAIDPATWSSVQLDALSGSDDTREIQSASVSKDTAVAVTSGAGVGKPETLKFLQGDTVTELPWPAPPTFSINWNQRDDGVPSGRYVFRVAWRMEDGTIGPASGPLFTTTPTGRSRNRPSKSRDDRGGDRTADPSGDRGVQQITYEAQISVDAYPNGQPSGGWPSRIEGLVIIVHPEAAGPSTTDVSAPDVPGYRISSFDGLPDPGTTATWKDPLESIIASTPHKTRTLVHHEIAAGALYSFNGRMIMGDVLYDYERPLLKHMVAGADGGSDFHLMMRADIETSQGTITRYSEPVGFSSSAAETVGFKQGSIYYRDSRARSWAWLVSQDYSGSIDAATWKVLDVQGAEPELKEAGNANFAYVEPGKDQVSLKSLETSNRDITGDDGWTDGTFRAQASTIARPLQDNSSKDPDTSKTLSIELSDVLASDENLESVRVSALIGATVDARGGGYGTADATLTLNVMDGTGSDANSIGGFSVSIDESDEGGEGVYEASDFPSSDAVELELKLEAKTTGEANGGEADVVAYAEADSIGLDLSTATGGQQASTDYAGTVDKVDRDGTRIVWSEVNRPLDLPVENLAYVAEDEDDPVLAITSNAAPVSEGQYGDYPLVVLGKNSIWSMRTGSNPFVQNVSPIAPNMGVVSRFAYTNANGPVYAATDRGVVRLTPTPDGIVSAALHDGSFLSSMDTDTSLAHFTSEQGRREVWLSAGGQVYVFTQTEGAWSTLPSSRASWTRLDGRLYGLAGGEAVAEGQAQETHEVIIETAPCFLGAPSTAKRLRDVWLVQGARPAGGTQLLHVRGIGDGAYGLDFVTDLSVTMRLSRGLVEAASFWLKTSASQESTFSGIGVRYEFREQRRPNAPVSDDNALLGAGATQSDLESDLSW